MPRYGIFAENAFRLTEGQSVVPSDGYRALCQLCVSGNKVSQTSQALEGINVEMSPGGAPFSNERISNVRSQVTDTDGTSRRADERRRACRKERMMMNIVNMMMNMTMVVALEVDGRGLPRGLPVCRRSALLTRAT